MTVNFKSHADLAEYEAELRREAVRAFYRRNGDKWPEEAIRDLKLAAIIIGGALALGLAGYLLVVGVHAL